MQHPKVRAEEFVTFMSLPVEIKESFVVANPERIV